VDYKYKRQIRFENIVSGTFTICGKVLDASKIIGFDYSYSDNESTLTIKLDTSKWDFRLKKESLFSYQLNLDDTSCPDDSQYLMNPGNTVKMTVNLDDFNFETQANSCLYTEGLVYYPCYKGGESGN
jgi:hypothetical protein